MPTPENIVKTTRVIVADDAGNILASSDRGGDVSVVSFRYKFDDEDPDECTIKLQTSEPLAFDKIKIGRSSRLQVAWGYIGGPITYTATVVIRDLETKYGKDQITTELICTDLLVYLNTVRSEAGGERSVVEHIIDEFYGKYKVAISDSGNLIWSLDLNTTQEEKIVTSYNYYDVWPMDPLEVLSMLKYSAPDVLVDSSGPYPKFKRNPNVRLDAEKQAPVSFVGRNISPYRTPPGPGPYANTDIKRVIETGPAFWHCEDDNEIKTWLEKSRGVVQTNRSQMTVLQDLFKECPKGPWYVTGRGQTILIHNRDFISRPVRLYTYQNEPGNLIDFTAKTKYDQFEKNSVKHEIFDEKKAVFYELGAYLDELFSMATFQEKFNNKKVSEEDFEKWFESWLNLMQAYEKWQVTRVGFSIYDQELGIDQKIYIKEGTPINDKEMLLPPFTLSDNTKVAYPSPYYHNAVLRGFIYSRPIQFFEDRDNFISNEKRMMEMEKEEAKITVEGDPFLQTQMRVQVDNVHYQHKGSYYIKKCEHSITQQGYRTVMDCIKVLSTNKLSTADKSEKVKILEGEPSVEIEAQYIREKELFGKPIKIIKHREAQITTDIGVGYGVHMDLSQSHAGYTRTTDLQEEMDKDDFIQTIIELRKSGLAKAEVNTEEN